MAKRQLMFSFSSEVSAQAVIIELGQQFNLKVNIEPEITEDVDWIELELEGEDQDIDEAISWAISKGVRVETLKSEG